MRVPALLLLLAAQAWPLSFPGEPKVKHSDLNGDGIADERATQSDGGTGWATWTECLRDGASGHVACSESYDTAYGMFTLHHRTLVPTSGNRAESLLHPDTCVAYDPSSAGQGALQLLRDPQPTPGELRPPPRWRPGKPVDQPSVCMSVEQGRGFAGWDLALDADGGDPPELPSDMIVAYRSAWPTRTSDGQPFNYTPKPVLDLGPILIYRHGHALAAYEPGKDRHTWLLHLGSPRTGHKLDRWESIQSLSPDGERAFIVHVGGYGEPWSLRVVAPP